MTAWRHIRPEERDLDALVLRPGHRTSLWIAAFACLVLGGCMLDWSRDDPTQILTPCPTEEPDDNVACSLLTQECEYGQDPRPSCRTVRICTSDGWVRKCTVPGEPSCVECKALSASDCPASPDGSNTTETCMTPESMDQFLCLYESAEQRPVQCGCVICEGPELCEPEPFEWYCSTGVSQPGCPPVAPEFGQACDSERLTCIYGTLQLQTLMRRECRNGIWLKY